MESRASTNGLVAVCSRVGGLRLVLLLAALLLVLPACKTSGPSPATQPQKPAYLVHVVQYPGETLSIIAGWYTGSPRNWELLLDANPGLNPKRIRLGDSIRIPRELLSREDPMPRSVMGSAQRKGAAAAPESSPSSSGESEMPQVAPSSVESSGETMTEPTTEESESVMEELLAPTETESTSEEAPSEIDESTTTEAVSAIVEGSESEMDESSQTQEPATENTEAPTTEEPSTEMRIKSRDELLKELLEE